MIKPILFAAAIAAGPVPAFGQAAEARSPLGLMGTIPIYWGEAAGLSDIVRGGAKPHWARSQMETEFELQPLDTLDPQSLAPLDFLMLAQPRVLSPAENVALDDWVRRGGRLLLFADPMMTGHSEFGIGDRRRPQDVALLSPILSHWGLELVFDAGQAAEKRSIASDDLELPIFLPGRLKAVQDAGGETAGQACKLASEAVIAQCRIGGGQALIVADAAMLDLHEADPLAPAALGTLLELSFGE